MPGGMGGGMPPGAGGGAPAGSGQVRLYTSAEPAVALPAVMNTVNALGCAVRDLSFGTPSLEDVFIHLTGRELR
jgi:ABC-2 type transport system ATP-binding protein